MSGFYLMSRGWQDNPLFGREEYSRRDAWIWLIEQAAYSARAINISGKTVTLERGQLSSSLRFMAKAWGWDEAKVRRFLSRARSENMIDASTDAGQTVITICNYDRYQALEKATDAPSDAVTTQQRRGSDAKYNEGKEIKEKKEARERAPASSDYEVPEWVPAEPWAAYAAMRKRKKAPIDSYIAAKQFKKLAELRDAGWDAAKVLDKATVNNWTDLWEPTPGRDDDMRITATSTSGKAISPADHQATLERLKAKGFSFDEPAKPPPRREGTGQHSIGKLVQGIGRG